jgi:hypothetical protein
VGKTVTVNQGDTLSGIAADNGFLDYHTVWNDPGNADLRNARDPHALFPGDRLSVPDFQTKTESRATGASYTFVIPVSDLYLRLRVLDLNARAIQDAPCDLEVELNGPASKSTDKKGLLTPEERIKPKAHSGDLVVHVQKKPANPTDPPPEEKVNFLLKIGDLNPETKLSGQQARLNNLGYFAGFELDDLEQFLWAAEEFECDHINLSQSRVAQRPTIRAVLPQNQKDGQEFRDGSDGQNVDPTTDTGVIKTATGDFRKTLRIAHDGH